VAFLPESPILKNWWGMGRVERRASKGLRLQRSGGAGRPYWHPPKEAKIGSGPANRTLLFRLMRPEGSPDLYPLIARMEIGGGRAHSKPMPCGAIGFQDRAGASPVHPPTSISNLEDPGGYDPLADGLKGRSLSIRV